MKGEYVDQHHHHHLKHETTTTAMFSKLPNHHRPLPFATHFHLSRDSEDDDTSTTGTATNITPPPTKPSTEPPTSTGATDGASIEVVRRPRGRPPGSKNKPKPPVILTREPEPVMSPYILEVPGGSDVVEAISRFCRRKNIGICVLTASGAVANVTLRQPSVTTSSTTVTFHGRFDILSISATFIPQTVSYPMPNTFTISLAGPQGQIVGGLVAGSLVAAATVYIVAATFNNPSYHRLVDDGGRNDNTNNSGSAEDGQSPAVSGGGGGDSSGGGEGGGMAMYSSHLGSDVIWAPTARPPHHY